MREKRERKEGKKEGTKKERKEERNEYRLKPLIHILYSQSLIRGQDRPRGDSFDVRNTILPSKIYPFTQATEESSLCVCLCISLFQSIHFSCLLLLLLLSPLLSPFQITHDLRIRDRMDFEPNERNEQTNR